MEIRNENARGTSRDRRDRISLPPGNGAGSVPSFDNTNTDGLLTVAEAARFLAISVAGMRRLQQRRLVPFIKVGRSLRFAGADLRAYVARRRVESIG
jgi:excisionase family DNA binding protein